MLVNASRKAYVYIVINAMLRQTKRRVALLVTIVSACVLLFFVVIGEIILKALSIPLHAFQISGGIVLFRAEYDIWR